MDKLLAKLSEQQATLQQQNEALMSANGDSFFSRAMERSDSLPISPVADMLRGGGTATARPASVTPSEQAAADEVARLKLQLEQAQNKISHLESQTKLTDSGRVTPVGGSASEMPIPAIGLPLNRPLSSNPSHAGISRLPFPRDGGWPNVDEGRSDVRDAFSTGSFDRSRTIWNNSKPAYVNTFAQAAPVPMNTAPQPVPWCNSRGSVPPFDDVTSGYSSGAESYRQDRLTPDPDMMGRSNARRGNRFDNRYGGNAGFGSSFGSYNMTASAYDQGGSFGNNSQGGMGGSLGLNAFPPYQQQDLNSMSSPLSPHASEFSFPTKSDVCPNMEFSFVSIIRTDCFTDIGNLGWLRSDYFHAIHRTSQLPSSPGS